MLSAQFNAAVFQLLGDADAELLHCDEAGQIGEACAAARPTYIGNRHCSWYCSVGVVVPDALYHKSDVVT